MTRQAATEMNLNFASDNTGPVAGPIMDAILAANRGGAMPYGADPWMPEVRARLREMFDWPEAEVLLVATGTGANALALAGLVRPWESVLCHRIAHIEVDECGAPEFYTGGAKMILIDGPDAKMSPDALAAALAGMEGSVHNVQRGALSLSNVTEAGTLYTLDELAALTDLAHAEGLVTHLDGARFANACAALECTAAELARGFDMVSFGGTKNGCMGVEAIVMRDPARLREMELRRKRAGQLWSKHRFLSAQMAAYLRDDLWLANARAANAAGRRLAAGLERLGAELVHPVQANMIFVRLDRDQHARAMAEAQFVQYDDAPRPLCRMVCDFTKTGAEVDRLLELVAG
ncbi:threonine aldolase family protein [Jannaschia ovalis]|uniref:Beta-eliminating lyase-related protein n=1 Tax=Jannaschia ovalis TaxID=3038773 RepID=A0ABY8L8D5_9RHOB|nr:beta-eliminating lyase-related protein [Jannaschia sp. GRR-S6-38]WGH77620.1 beta-eliminating lyase-related protein [Jannaschia sp. GRR-S6-38]